MSVAAISRASASEPGAMLLDRRLYLPEEWTLDSERCAAAQVPTDVTFQNKPKLARAMLEQAFANGVTAGWVTADSLYGCDRSLRLWLARRRQAFVLEVRSTERVWVIAGDERRQRTVAAAAAETPADAWQRLSAGAGTKGSRVYDWARIPVAGVRQDDWRHWLLVRRGLTDPADHAYLLVAGPPAATMDAAVRVAGMRWRIERCFEEAKGEAGLDEYEVHHWHSWQRHITLSMLAHAFLVWSRQVANAAEAGSPGGAARAAVGGRGSQVTGARTAVATTRGTPDLVTLAATASGTRQAEPLPAAWCPASTGITRAHYLRL